MPTYESGDVYVCSEEPSLMKLFIKERGTKPGGRWMWLKAGHTLNFPELSESPPEPSYYHYGNISELFCQLEAAIIAQIEEEGT